MKHASIGWPYSIHCLALKAAYHTVSTNVTEKSGGFDEIGVKIGQRSASQTQTVRLLGSRLV